VKRATLVLAAVAVLSMGIGGYFAADQASRRAGQERAVASLFALSLPDAEGNPQPLGRWKGKTLVINFWATWCAPCVEEIPELSALQTEISAKSMQILGIGIDSPSNIRDFAARNQVAFPLFVAGAGGSELSRKFGDSAGALPFTVLISSDGIVRKTYLGRLDIKRLRSDLGLN
jgi:peroxiredoxin